MADPVPPTDKPPRRRRRLVIITTLLCTYLLVVMFGGCADALLLYPSSEGITTDGADRIEVPVPSAGAVEVFCRHCNLADSDQPDGYVLIFDGNGGRAERGVFWGDQVAGACSVQIWAMNYPGYGGSPGKARLSAIAPAALAAYDALKQKAGDKPVVIWGTSLGSAAALYVAANRPVSGLVLMNPPPLRQLIMGKYGWWNLWLAAIPVSLGVPPELDSIANARRTICPVLVSTATHDTLVPPDYQRKVYEACAGPTHVVTIDGGHNTPAVHGNPNDWKAGVAWLWSQLGMGGK